MYALIGIHRKHRLQGLYQVDGGMQFLLDFEDMEANACCGPVFLSRSDAHEARLRFRGKRLDWTGSEITLERVVELDATKIRELIKDPAYKASYVEAIRLGEEWAERDPKRGKLLPGFRA